MTPDALSAIIGEEAALSLMAQRAGLRVYIPKTITERIVEECGGDRKAAAKLCELFGGEFVIFPAGRRWRAEALLRRGLSLRDVAMTVGMTRRRVVQIASETRLHPDYPGRDVA